MKTVFTVVQSFIYYVWKCSAIIWSPSFYLVEQEIYPKTNSVCFKLTSFYIKRVYCAWKNWLEKNELKIATWNVEMFNMRFQTTPTHFLGCHSDTHTSHWVEQLHLARFSGQGLLDFQFFVLFVYFRTNLRPTTATRLVCLYLGRRSWNWLRKQTAMAALSDIIESQSITVPT